MLDARQSFKFGFLLRCADEGLAPEQVQERIKYANKQLQLVKQATVASAAMAAPGLITSLLTNLGWLGVGASALAGGAAGAGLASMADSEVDPQSAKRQELAAAYQQQADRLRRSLLARQYHDEMTSPQRKSFS